MEFRTKNLRAELIQLVRRHEPLLEGLGDWIDEITCNDYRKRTLYYSVIHHKYRDIAWELSGHETNEGCKGIFAYVHDEDVERVMLLILMELLASIDRPLGGTIHQLGKDADAA